MGGGGQRGPCSIHPSLCSLSPVSGVQPCNPSSLRLCPVPAGRGQPCDPVPLTARPPLPPQRTRQSGKGSAMPVLKRSATVARNMRLRPRTALVDIGNRVTQPKTWGAARKLATSGGLEREPGSGPVSSSPERREEKQGSRRKRGTAPTEEVLPPAPEPKRGTAPTEEVLPPAPEPKRGTAPTEEVLPPAPEPKRGTAPTEEVLPQAPEPKPEPQPQQLESHSPIPIEIPGCAPSDDMQCQAFSGVLLHAENVVAEDGDDPNFCRDYAKDIYKYLRELEENHTVRPKYLAGQEINGKMRAILIDWLVELHMKFRLLHDTLYMSVAITDCFLQDNAVSKKMLPLVGVTAMLIASKYEEIYPVCVADFVYITDGAYTNSQICQMEIQILQALEFHLSRPLASHFLRMVSEAAQVDKKQHVLARYLMVLSIVDYDMVHFPPSKTAAAACCLSLKLLNGCEWTQALPCHTSYTECDLLPVMQHIAKNVVLVNRGITKETAIKNKYASPKNTRISTIEQLNSPIIQNLAQSLKKKR
ncbi:G2/mitotic-specific cyclin-B1 isoform X3 [Strigops habroptila]|uniref:G2/mitotic-specific cyclin-B1 isoform X2 n=1 Tax=Strigops habroptila TaxID=2489341 RepID=UPI0011CF6695|nr:G2/mitotic-specific cyclin-B1 isoform X2 [Strigops habroptila]XP_030367726.1 G2/mitotic-specific cyclin-B1 isoform X3 [Strigops habroptila]